MFGQHFHWWLQLLKVMNFKVNKRQQKDMPSTCNVQFVVLLPRCEAKAHGVGDTRLCLAVVYMCNGAEMRQ